jgi:hypothetical protein
MGHANEGLGFLNLCGCSSVVEHLLAKENVESSNLFIRFLKTNFFILLQIQFLRKKFTYYKNSSFLKIFFRKINLK